MDRTFDSRPSAGVDQMSLWHLAGTTVDYVEAQGAGYSAIERQVDYGCGSSFSV
jgi:Fe-S cluster assembly iron-binding protein IscA